MSLTDTVLSDERDYPMCDFAKLHNAILLKDEKAAKDWYCREFSASCFAKSAYEPVRRLKNGFIVLVGYMRQVAVSRNKSSVFFWKECGYLRLIESCTDADGVYGLFVEAFRDFTENMQGVDRDSRECSKLYNCVNYIMKNLDSQLTLATVAANCGYNPSYLGRKFKQVYGETVNNFILSQRMNAASEMLLYTDESIAEIAAYFKFSSQSHFHNVFKKYFSLTPLQYQNKYRTT